MNDFLCPVIWKGFLIGFGRGARVSAICDVFDWDTHTEAIVPDGTLT